MRDALTQQLLDVMPLGLLVWQLTAEDDDSLRLLYANPAASELASRDLSRLVGELASAIFPVSTKDRLALIANTCRDGQRRHIAPFPHAPGTARSDPLSGMIAAVGERCAALFLESGAAPQRVANEARSATHFLDSIIEHLPAMVFVKDAKELRFERFNRAGEALLGVDRGALLSKNDYDLFPKEQADFFVASDREVLSRRGLRDIPSEPIQTPRGTRWLHTRKIPILDERGEPRFLLGVSIDITDQKRAEERLRWSHDVLEQDVRERAAELERQIAERVRAEDALTRTEEQLRQSQKMEAIGLLAGGVAHDFNNMLSVVLGYSDLVLQQLPEGAPEREPVQQIRFAGTRAAELTRQLLAFSRRQVLHPRTLDVNGVLTGLTPLLQRLVGEDIALSVHTSPDLGFVKADPSQLEQVVMNLVVNARDAMATGGKLTIETSEVMLDADFAAAHFGSQIGPHVMLAVSDTGMGMDKDTLSRIFEPFFTTKDVGKGTGLGLSTVFGIVQQSGGSVWVYSELDRGTTFKVYLPIVGARLSDPPASLGPPEDICGTETVLLVEDEVHVRTLVATCLRERGYRVLEAENAAVAIEQAQAFAERIQLLLTDVVMPGMGGRALAEHLLRCYPTMRVLFMSGYTDDAIVRHGVLESAVAFLQKPITPAVLALRIREVLDGPPNKRHSGR